MGSKQSLCSNCKDNVNIKRKTKYCDYCSVFYDDFNIDMERMEEYKKEKFTPLNKKYEMYNKAFIGNVCKYNTKFIILLGTDNNTYVDKLFWEIISTNVDQDFLSGVAIADNFIGKHLLAVPRDVFIIIGMSTGSNISLVDEGKMQVYLPKKIVIALLESSKLFISTPLSSVSKLSFITKGFEDVEDIQNKWWAQYNTEALVGKCLQHN